MKSHDNSLISARQVEIMTALDMDQGLVGIKGSRASLETTWKRYTTITKAISKVCDTEWEKGMKPADSEIIAVYGGKSTYYDQLKVLQHVRIHPDMVKWLERTDFDVDLADEAISLWGFYKTTYMLTDLEKWLVRKQKESNSDRKGKKKETVPGSSRKGKKNKDDDDDSSPPSKRVHRKSVGGRN
jgi:hypothetical protein